MDCSLPASSIHEIFKARIRNGLPFLSPGDLLDPAIKPRSHAWQADSLPSMWPRSPPVVKNPPVVQEMWETWVQSLDQEDPLEKGMGAHSSILAWRIPWTERGAFWATTVHGITKSLTLLKWQRTDIYIGIGWTLWKLNREPEERFRHIWKSDLQ